MGYIDTVNVTDKYIFRWLVVSLCVLRKLGFGCIVLSALLAFHTTFIPFTAALTTDDVCFVFGHEYEVTIGFEDFPTRSSVWPR